MAGLAAYTSNFCIHKLEASLVYSMRSVLFFFLKLICGLAMFLHS